MRTLASDPSTRASPLQSAARTGSCTVAFIRRGVPLPSVSGLRSLAGRMVLPSVRPAALMGFLPFAVLLPPRVGRHFCRPGPTCRSRHAPVPIDFRRGDSKRPVAITWEAKVGRSGSGGDGDRLLGFAPVCGPRPRLSWPRDAILPWALPLAGLWAHDLRIRPGTSPDRITSLRAAASTRDCTIRSWALANPSRTRHVGALPPFRILDRGRPACRRHRLPFSVLKGLMPRHSE